VIFNLQENHRKINRQNRIGLKNINFISNEVMKGASILFFRRKKGGGIEGILKKNSFLVD
jgi:hypothetical protein